jgi:peroxiredoxin Q/BCP
VPTKKPTKAPVGLAHKGPSLDSIVKNFELSGTHGGFKLKELKGQIVVLYFYPRDNTPGCTTEGHEFSDLLAHFKKANAVVYGISRDTLKSHEGFKEKQNYKVDLLSDHEEQACGIFDVVKDKNMYGKKVRGIERSTFVIGEDGKLKKEWRKVKVEGHAREVLDFVKGLNR